MLMLLHRRAIILELPAQVSQDGVNPIDRPARLRNFEASV